MFRLAARQSASAARLLATRLDLTAANVCHAIHPSFLDSLDRTNDKRHFSSKASSKKTPGVKAPLINERLITHLIRKHNANSAHDVDVRLVVSSDQGGTKTSLVSLMNAVQVCTDLGVDLVEINLEQSPPIIKAQNAEKLVYQAEKRLNGKSNSSKPMKGFQMNAGIAHYDFTRKVDLIVSYLQKGHNCQVQIRANASARRKDAGALRSMVDRLSEAVKSIATPGPVKANEDSSNATIMLRPTGKKEKE